MPLMCSQDGYLLSSSLSSLVIYTSPNSSIVPTASIIFTASAITTVSTITINTTATENPPISTLFSFIPLKKYRILPFFHPLSIEITIFAVLFQKPLFHAESDPISILF